MVALRCWKGESEERGKAEWGEERGTYGDDLERVGVVGRAAAARVLREELSEGVRSLSRSEGINGFLRVVSNNWSSAFGSQRAAEGRGKEKTHGYEKNPS